MKKILGLVILGGIVSTVAYKLTESKIKEVQVVYQDKKTTCNCTENCGCKDTSGCKVECTCKSECKFENSFNCNKNESE